MSNRTIDLSPLGGAAVAARVPRPPARWLTRVALPASVALAAVAILTYGARDLLVRRVPVRVAPVIPAAHFSSEAADPGAAPEGVSPATPRSPAQDQLLAQAPGWVEPAPYAVNVPALAEGVIAAVLVLEGDRVEAGQVVARMIDDDARLDVRAAEADVRQRRADIDMASAGVRTAEARVAVERAALEELTDDIERRRPLVGVGGVSAGEFRQSEIRRTALEARVEIAEREIAEARARLAQIEATLAPAEVVLDQARLRLSRMEIRAPASGVVLAREVDPGSRIMFDATGMEPGASRVSGSVLRLYDPARLQVRVDVPLADAAKIAPGCRAQVVSEALPDRTFMGVVERAVHQANIQRNTVQFKVVISDPSPALKPEMLTRVKLFPPAPEAAAPGDGAASVAGVSGMSGTSGVLVPLEAITTGEGGAGVVWTVDPSGGAPRARRRDVRLAPEAQWPAPDTSSGVGADVRHAAVIAGLQITDRVLLSPPATLRDGDRLNIVSSAAAQTTEPATAGHGDR